MNRVPRINMLKQSPRRNQRSKGFKIKHVLQICLLLAICIWLLYKMKSALEERSGIAKLTNGRTILKLGRKGLDQELEEIAAEFKKHDNFEDDKVGQDGMVGLGLTDKDKNGVTEDEIDGQDQEKAKEELEDFIDEDDNEQNSVSEVDSYGDDVEVFSNQHHIVVERNFEAAEGTL